MQHRGTKTVLQQVQGRNFELLEVGEKESRSEVFTYLGYSLKNLLGMCLACA